MFKVSCCTVSSILCALYIFSIDDFFHNLINVLICKSDENYYILLMISYSYKTKEPKLIPTRLGVVSLESVVNAAGLNGASVGVKVCMAEGAKGSKIKKDSLLTHCVEDVNIVSTGWVKASLNVSVIKQGTSRVQGCKRRSYY